MLNKLFAFLISVIIFSACSKDEHFQISKKQECTFEQIDENNDGLIDNTERSIMNNCIENQLNTRAEIETNLIGEWELVGHGEGWIPKISQPCGYINIQENGLTFEFSNAYIDTVITTQWEIEELIWPNGSYFILKTDEEYTEGLFINRFCENYMFGDATPSDGNMYLYEKL